MSAKALSAIVAVVLLGALVVGAFAIVPTLFKAKQDIPKLLANDTQFYASINPNLSAIKGIKNIQDAYKSVTDQNSQASQDLNQQAADKLGVNFKDDVQPWLGTEMAVGVSGIKDLSGNTAANTAQVSKNAHLVFILATRDKTKSQAFLDKLRKKLSDAGAFTDETYQAVKLTARSRPANGQSTPLNALATIGDYVVLGSDVDTLKGIVDRSKDPKNMLSENPHFQMTLAGLPKTAVGYVFLDGEPIATSIKQALDKQLADMQPEQRQQMQKSIQTIAALQGLGSSVSIVGQGIALDTAMKFDYGFVGDDLVLGVGEAPLTAAGSGSKQPLVNDPNFKAVQSNLPTKNGGVWYFNVPQVVDTIAKVQGKTANQIYNTSSGKGIKPIKGIGIAGGLGVDDTSLGKGRVFILLDNK